MKLTWSENNIKKIAEHIHQGKLAVVLTDTIYGILAKADDKEAVERVYKTKGRQPAKPFIILIGDRRHLDKFGISLGDWEEEQLKKYWPGKVSIVMACDNDRYKYLHRETKSLAFRLPNDELLISLLRETGPLIAPSANPEGFLPAVDIAAAEKYFGQSVDIYVDGGERQANASTLISIIDREIKVLRN